MLGIRVDEAGLKQYLEREKPFAKIRQIILHHTYRPTTKQYRGLATIKGIWNYHTHTCGWGDIGYHVLVGPDGAIWLGRPISRQGAHTRGQNHNSLGVSMIGDFDEEVLGEAQREETAAVLKAMLERYDLRPEDVHFHRDYAHKTCPGTLIKKQEVRKWVAGTNEGVTVYYKGTKVAGVGARVSAEGRVIGQLAELAKALRPEAKIAWDNERKILKVD